MRLFQNSGSYPAYHRYFRSISRDVSGFQRLREAFLADRFGASHFLLPVLEGNPEAFFTNGDDERMQRAWAQEAGMPSNSPLDQILLSQIEAHRTEVFYNLDPMRYASDFVRRLPSCVRVSVAWRAAPSPGADFGAYGLLVCNFPSILAEYERLGWRTGLMYPAHDPEIDAYASNDQRPDDVIFVGGYTRHHRRRAAILEKVAGLGERFRVAFHLDRSRLTRIAEHPVCRWLPLARHRRPVQIMRASREPLFGRALYGALSRAKIVLNGAIDMAGQDRGNMRCFEALGCRALMVSDEGIYPAGMEEGKTMKTYGGPDDAAKVIAQMLEDDDERRRIADRGYELVKERYSKDAQWRTFCNLVDGV